MDGASTDTAEPAVANPDYYFDWRGVVFTYHHGNFPGFQSGVVAGDMWHAAAHVSGWRWTARLTVNGGTASGQGTTPWQALDAAVTEWQALVAKLAQSLQGGTP